MTNTHNRPTHGYGWVFYDDECPRCSRLVKRFTKVFIHRQILTAPLQRGWVQQILELSPNDAITEMRVLTANDKVLGGATAMVYLAERIWWARPLSVIAKLPGVMRILHYLYKNVAVNRHGKCNCQTNTKVISHEAESATHTTKLPISEPGRAAPIHARTEKQAHTAMIR